MSTEEAQPRAQDHQLAEVNVARLRASLDDPAMAKFVKAIDDVNWLAERSAGFVWRLRPDAGPVAQGEVPGEGQVVITVSVWTDFVSLQDFVIRTAHGLFMRQRQRWFIPMSGFTTALWWVPAGEQPTVAQATDRLAHLRARGPSPHAFSLRRQFAPDGGPVR